MANTYTQIYIQVVFSVQGRQNLISPQHREELQKYISGIIRNQKHKTLAINCMPDHLHVLIGLRPDAALSDLVRDIKACSSAFITDHKWIAGKFNWQEGFGGFSYSHSEVHRVIKYIFDQESHHRVHTFNEEYVKFLHDFDITHKEAYLFERIDVYDAKEQVRKP